MSKNLLYVSDKGGTINSSQGDKGSLYRVCSESLYLYCDDLLTAKVQLERLETRKSPINSDVVPLAKRCGKTFNELIESSAAPHLEEDFPN